MAEIKLENVVKRYPDGALAVDNFNMDIADGEFIILVGPSGCGKSTLLNMVAGLEDITAGKLIIDGQVVNDKAPKDRDIAMVFQSYALYPHMTVGENMGFPLKLAKAPEAEIKKKVKEVAEMLELTAHLDRRPSNLSGGQRQRVAMGRAIVRSPKAFLMDEPLSNLDAKLRVQMRTQVSRIQKSLATTTLYVTHDQTEAMTLGDRVVVMKGGVIQQEGEPTYLYEHPTNLFVAGFIGSPSMNFLTGTLGNGTVTTPLGEAPLPDNIRQALDKAKTSGTVVVGIRPEHFEDASLVQGDKLGGRFTAPIDLVEAMGSDVYAYFTVKGDVAQSAQLDELAKDSGSEHLADGIEMTARLDASSRVRRNSNADLWYDTSKICIFDPDSGINLVEGDQSQHGTSTDSAESRGAPTK